MSTRTGLAALLCVVLAVMFAGAAGAGGTTGARLEAGDGEPVRIAVLSLGVPSDEEPGAEVAIGREVLAKDFELVVPMLERERIDIVVVRVNCWLGHGRETAAETARFVEVFTKEFAPRFRTVAWVESAVDAAAVAVWPMKALYFMPGGTLGAAVLEVEPMVAAKGEELAAWLRLGEAASNASGRDPRIMRAMQSMSPLSATILAGGRVRWHGDLKGNDIVNAADRILTLSDQEALSLRISRGTVDSREALARALGVERAEWVGEEAAGSVRAAVAARRDRPR